MYVCRYIYILTKFVRNQILEIYPESMTVKTVITLLVGIPNTHHTNGGLRSKHKIPEENKPCIRNNLVFFVINFNRETIKFINKTWLVVLNFQQHSCTTRNNTKIIYIYINFQNGSNLFTFPQFFHCQISR